MATQRFKTIVAKTGSRTASVIPCDPNAVWGIKQRHHITGTINGCTVRGSLVSHGSGYFLPLGAAWRRDSGVEAGAEVEVVLGPEGPQSDTLKRGVLALFTRILPESESGARGGGSLDAHTASRSGVITRRLDGRQTVGRRQG